MSGPAARAPRKIEIVRARSALHCVVPGAAVNRVVAEAAVNAVISVAGVDPIVPRIADDEVVDGVAVPGKSVANKREVVDPVGKDVVKEAAAYLVHAGVDLLDHHIAGIVDIVDVVARTADHAVGAALTVQRIVAVQAVDRVIAERADERVVAGRTSDHRTGTVLDDDVIRGEHRRRLQRRDELRCAATRAVGVVIKFAACRVVHDAVIRIMSAGRAGRRVEARVHAAHLPARAERHHDCRI